MRKASDKPAAAVPAAKRKAKQSVLANSAIDTPKVKKKRVPVGARNILGVMGKEDGFVYRFVNDVADRVQQFLDGGYELVDAETHRVGDRRVGVATPEGSKAQVPVGNDTTAYLMRIPAEDYAEDQAAKQKRIDELERSLKQPGAADYGRVKISNLGDKE